MSADDNSGASDSAVAPSAMKSAVETPTEKKQKESDIPQAGARGSRRVAEPVSESVSQSVIQSITGSAQGSVTGSAPGSVVESALEGPEPGHEPSAVNLRLSRLRNSAMKAIRTRPRVPQPLFWSLLHSELKEIKRMKRKARLEREAWIRGESSE